MFEFPPFNMGMNAPQIPPLPQFNIGAPQMGQVGGTQIQAPQLPQVPGVPGAMLPTGIPQGGVPMDLMGMLAGSHQKMQQMAQQAATIPVANRPMLEVMKPFMQPAPTVGALAQPTVGRKSPFASRDRDRTDFGSTGYSSGGGNYSSGGGGNSGSTAGGGKTTSTGGGGKTTGGGGKTTGGGGAKPSLDIRDGSTKGSIGIENANESNSKASGGMNRGMF